MPSSIDTSKPIQGAATTASVRANFTAAKTEIEALQAASHASGSDNETAASIGALIGGAATKTAPDENDKLSFRDSIAGALQAVTWTNIKATIKTYFDTLYNVKITASGLLKGNGSAVSAATPGTDYVTPNAAITGATKMRISYDDKGLVTSGADASLDDLADTIITNPQLDQFLRFNGTNWVPGNLPASAGAGVAYYLALADSDITNYGDMETLPLTIAETGVSATLVSTDGEVLLTNGAALASFATLAGLPALTLLDSGVWVFTCFAGTDSVIGTQNLVIKTFKRAANGTETLLFTATSDALSTSITQHDVTIVQNDFVVLSTDRIVTKYYALNDSATSATVTMHLQGDVHYSHIVTPLRVVHNSQAGIQGGTNGEAYHLTAAEYAGTGTDVFVRKISPDIETPNISDMVLAKDALMTKILSAGVTSAADINNIVVASGTAGAVDTTAFTALLRTSALISTALANITVAATTALAIPSNTARYVIATYNGSTATISASATDTSNGWNIITLALVENVGGTIHMIVPMTALRADYSALTDARWWEINGVKRASGAILSAPAALKVKVSAAVFWSKLTRILTNTFDSNATGTFWMHYVTAGTWTTVSGQSTLPVTQYNDINTGLVALTSNNYYGYYDVYLGTDGDVRLLYGQAQYTTQLGAETAPVSATLPVEISTVAYQFIGRFTFRRNASSVTSTLSAFTGTLNLSGVPTTASQVANTPAGNIAATDVQSALNELDTEKGGLAVANTWAAQQTPKNGALTDAATVAWDGDANGQVVTLANGATRAMGAPTNIKQYAAYILRVTPTGAFSLTFNAAFKFGGSGAPTLTSTSGKTDILSFLGGASNTLEYLGIRKDAV